MRSSFGLSRCAGKTGVFATTLLLVLILLSPLASGKKAQPVEGLPPDVHIHPSSIQPGQPASPEAGKPHRRIEKELRKIEKQAEKDAHKNSEPGTPIPSGDTFAEVQPVATPEPDILHNLVDRGVFAPDDLGRQTPVRRSELATILVRALKHNTILVSEFPFYRDVPRSHPAYVPVEVARAKKLISKADHGFYYPDEPVTYGEVYQAIAQAITGPPPSENEAAHLLAAFTDRDELPPEVQSAVAKMARSRSFWKNNQGDLSSHWNQAVKPDGLAPLIGALMYLTENRVALLPEKTSAPVLPADLVLSVSPISAIFESRLNVGERLIFSLAYRSGPLPKGTRLEGAVREVGRDRHYIVELTRVETPEGDLYTTSAELTLVFKEREQLSFIVPGELFRAVTRIPANASASASPLPPPAEPAGSSTRTAAPPLTPPTK